MIVTAEDVKKLREMTGAGMMDCKTALNENAGDIQKAIEFLRKKGMASAQKRSGKAVREGAIMSYLHPGNRLAVLVELNCETDFVAKTDEFLQLAKDIAMQIAATNPMAIHKEGVPESVVKKELEIYRDQMKDQKKPDHVIEKIITGKLEKYYQEVVLLEQSFVKDPNKTVREYLLEVSGRLGEAMSIRRFVRYQLGEEIPS